MAASTNTAPILKTLAPSEFKSRLSVDRALLPRDGVDVPVILDLNGCHAKPRVLASCTSGQELLFSEAIVAMVRDLANASGATELRIRFADREVASLPTQSSGPMATVRVDDVADMFVRLVGIAAAEAAVARARR